MVRNRQRKTERASIPPEVVKLAVRSVMIDGNSYKTASEEFGVAVRSLKR
mgnify:CR=1 FL=1